MTFFSIVAFYFHFDYYFVCCLVETKTSVTRNWFECWAGDWPTGWWSYRGHLVDNCRLQSKS